jgi:glucokinase
LGLKRFIFLNDFVVSGYGILAMKEGLDYEKIDNNPITTNAPMAMIGAGTGLGFGYLVKSSGSKYYDVFPAEGGHQDFSPQTEKQWRYEVFLKKFYQIEHVSVERACAGPSIPHIFKFLVEVEKEGDSTVFKSLDEIDTLTPEVIVENGLNDKCPVCKKTIEFFIEMYGAAAGNMSLLLLPIGGLYILGGLSNALEDYIRNGSFLKSFKNKGRLEPLLSKIPLFLVKNSLIGVKGANVYNFIF